MPLDTNGNGKVDNTDAIELFVATTMQDFGAKSLMVKFRNQHKFTAATSIDAVLASVRTAIAQVG